MHSDPLILHARRIVARVLACVVIVSCLWPTVRANTGIALPVARDLGSPLLNALYFHLAVQPLWWMDRAAWILGSSARWRMFSPPDKRNWRFLFEVELKTGEKIPYVLPYHRERDFIQRQFVDFREAKFELNIYTPGYRQELFAQHLCEEFRREGKDPVRVSSYLQWRDVLMQPVDQSVFERRDFWQTTRCLPLL